MKQLLLALLFCLCLPKSNFAQVVDDVAGKTYYYYDELSQKKMKEVFHHKQMIKIMPDPNNYGSYVDSVFYIKSGPYTRYYENGNLQCSGFYKDEKKDSTWKYYDSKGDFIKEEHYNKGVLVK
jgi:antitoxin component YwqK of YwqJK toxin-antitoxin module